MGRGDYDYQVGNKVMIKNKVAYKLKPPYKRPYEIIQKFINGTVTLKLGKNG